MKTFNFLISSRNRDQHQKRVVNHQIRVVIFLFLDNDDINTMRKRNKSCIHPKMRHPNLELSGD